MIIRKSIQFIFVLLSLFSTLAAAAAEGPVNAKDINLKFKSNGKLFKQISFKELQNLAKPQQVSIFEPHELVKKQMNGFNFIELMKSVYGSKWTKAQKVEFTCLDEYRPSLSADSIRNGKSFLAFSESNKDSFQILKNGKTVHLGPYYLIWDSSLSGEALQAHLHQGHWPYQIKEVDLIQ